MQGESSARSPARALEIVTTWGTTVLDATHLARGRCTIGPASDTDCFVDAADVPVARYVLARVVAGRPVVNVPAAAQGELMLGGEVRRLADLRAAGRLEPSREMPDSHALGLPPGSALRLRFGERAILLRPVSAEAGPPKTGLAGLLDTRFGWHVVVAAALHVLVAVAAISMPADAASLFLDSQARPDHWVGYAILPEQQLVHVERPHAEHPLDRVQPAAEAAPRAPRPVARAPRAGAPEPARGKERARDAAASFASALEGQGLWKAGSAVDPAALSRVDGRGGDGGPGDGPGLAGFPRGASPGDTASLAPGELPTLRPARPGPGGEPRYVERPTHQPQIVPRDPVIVGGIDKEVVRRVIRGHLAEVRYCYERALQGHPGLAGRVETRFVIGSAGAVLDARALESTVADPAVAACVVEHIRRWTFPPLAGEGTVSITYPFLFRPE
jgi:TonB family protein